MKNLMICVIAALSGSSCAETPSYVYTPDTTNALAAGMPATRTAIPQEAPQGAVELVSYGITRLTPREGPVDALHVRMIVTNDGDDTPWSIDTSQQLAEIAGEGQSRPLFVNSDVQTLPIVTVARHERHVLDFYYPLPVTIRDAANLPHFEMLWQVQTPARVVASRTSFDRIAEQPAVAYDSGYVYGWPYWTGYGPYWYAPWPVGFGFVHARPFGIRGGYYRGGVRVGHFGGRFHAGGGHIARAGGRR